MRRRLIKPNNDFSFNLVPLPENLENYIHRLRLLNEIPLTYLLTDISDLGDECIRFGIVDTNWVEAYIDGAFSIGSACENDCKLNRAFGCKARERKTRYLDTPRMKKMHPNHRIKRSLVENAANKDQEIDTKTVSVVLIRSQLIKTKKELHFAGYEKETELPILRIENISDDIMICLFSGIIDTFWIEEPLTGLKFGCIEDKNERKINLRSTLDNDDFGKPCNPPEFIPIKEYVEECGRIKAKELANYIGEKLNKKGLLDQNPITQSRFAFEMISVPHRAKFESEKTIKE